MYVSLKVFETDFCYSITITLLAVLLGKTFISITAKERFVLSSAFLNLNEILIESERHTS